MATLQAILKTGRVAAVRDERRSEHETDGNGIWADLKPGWRCPANDTHACHEWTIDDLYAAVLRAVPCGCGSCRLVRVPAKFFSDHEDRECEPFCEPVKSTKRFVWLRLDDPGLDELLSDARHYADEWGPDEIGDGGGLKRSAAATVRAIEAAKKAVS